MKKQPKRTLKSILDSFPKDTIFKLGFSGGAAFVFIGTRDEYNSIKNRLDDHQRNASRYTIDASGRKITKLCDEMEKTIAKLKSLTKSIDATNNDRITADRCASSSLDDLEVLDVSRSIDATEEPSMILNVEGFGTGKFWTVSEAETDRKRIKREMHGEG